MTSDPAAETCDILVIGGGPAGSTISTLLARKGWSVLQVERERHPRFHIGESLLPMNMPVFERLGLIEELDRIGIRKYGADFPAMNERGYNTFQFTRCLNETWKYAYQVKRADLDQMLFAHAGANGVRQIEQTKVTAIELGADGVVARATGPDGSARELRARYLVDATGRDALLGSKLGIKRRHATHQSAALFAHFEGVERRPEPDEGNISVYRFEQGWIWLIPLRDGTMSIGAVCWPEHLKQRRGQNAEFLLKTLQSVPQVAERIKNARIVDNLHVTGNYSYQCDRMAGPRWIMVGDAYAFVDPIFSSGVYLAMNSAELAVDVVDGALREPAKERALQRAYAKVINTGLDEFGWFIYRFTTPAMAHLFANPRNVWRVEEAVVSMLAGDVFRDGGVRARLRVFKLIYYITALGMLGANVRDFFMRRRRAADVFSGGTTSQDSA
jgi:flavin-dependent dehydrogenase